MLQELLEEETLEKEKVIEGMLEELLGGKNVRTTLLREGPSMPTSFDS